MDASSPSEWGTRGERESGNGIGCPLDGVGIGGLDLKRLNGLKIHLVLPSTRKSVVGEETKSPGLRAVYWIVQREEWSWMHTSFSMGGRRATGGPG